MTIPHTLESGDRSDRLAPRWFAVSAIAIPVGVLGQFLLAGMSLFVDARNWGLHGTLGMMLAIPFAIVAIATPAP